MSKSWELYLTKNINGTQISTTSSIIRCLSSLKVNCHIKSLLSAFKDIITPRIDYGLYLFGFTNTTLLQKLKIIINTGLLLILGAFRTTPTNNILFESGTLSIENRINCITTSLIKNRFMTRSHHLTVGGVERSATSSSMKINVNNNKQRQHCSHSLPKAISK